jgi:hypothetical protein
VVLPEMWNCPYSNDSFPTYAEDIERGSSESVAALAQVRSQGLGNGCLEHSTQTLLAWATPGVELASILAGFWYSSNDTWPALQ